MFCRICGKQIKNGGQFCPKCGTQVKGKSMDIDNISIDDNMVDLMLNQDDNEETEKFISVQSRVAAQENSSTAITISSEASADQKTDEIPESEDQQSDFCESVDVSAKVEDEVKKTVHTAKRTARGIRSLTEEENVSKMSEITDKKRCKSIIPIITVVVVILIAIVIVKGTKRTININDYLNVDYAGCDSHGVVSVYLDTDAMYNKYKNKLKCEGTSNAVYELAKGDIFSVSKTENLSNGDKIKVTWNMDKDFEKKFNHKFKFTDTEYTVEGLNKYITSVSEISNDALVSMQNKAVDIIKTYAVSLDNAEKKFDSCEYVGGYALFAKSADIEKSINEVILIYRVKNDIEIESENIKDQFEFFYYVQYEDIQLSPDGDVIVDFMNYKTPTDSTFYEVEYKSENRKLLFQVFCYDGYNTIDELIDVTVNEKLAEYTYEELPGGIKQVETESEEERVTEELNENRDYIKSGDNTELDNVSETKIVQACYEPPLEVNGDYFVLIKNVSSNLNVREEPKHDSKLVDTITDHTNLLYYGEWSEGIGSDGENHIWCKVYNIDTPGWVRSDLVLTIGKYYQKKNSSSINLRALPQHNSDLVMTVKDESPMYFYGETEKGLGSDGKEHEWYKVYLGDGITGWVRSDLVEEGQQYG